MPTVSTAWLRSNFIGWVLILLLSIFSVVRVVVSDSRRFQSIEERIQAIEERAGSCEVGPLK